MGQVQKLSPAADFAEPRPPRHTDMFCFVRHVFGGVREISNRTDTDLEWETKQNKTKQTGCVNVQSVVCANVECDSLHL